MDYSSNREISAVASLYSDLSIMTEFVEHKYSD